MAIASWVPKEIINYYPRLKDATTVFGNEYEIATKLISNDRLQSGWSGLKRINNDPDVLLFMQLVTIVADALHIPKHEQITQSERIKKAKKINSLAKQIIPLIDELGIDKQVIDYLPIEIRVMINKALENQNIKQLFEDSLPELKTPKGVTPTLSDVLIYTSSEASNRAIEKSVISAPNSKNYRELYFIRTISIHFYREFQKPMIATIETLLKIFFPDSQLNLFYIRDRIFEARSKP